MTMTMLLEYILWAFPIGTILACGYLLAATN